MWYWIITGFGFLFSLRAVRKKADEKRTSLSLYSTWRDSLDLLVSLLLLVTLYDTGTAWERFAEWFREAGFLTLWVAAFLVGKYQKKSEIFFISIAAIAFVVVNTYQQWGMQFSLCMMLVVGVFIFQAAFKGLKYALLFTRVPEPMKGWPILCLIAFCVVVTLSGFAALIF